MNESGEQGAATAGVAEDSSGRHDRQAAVDGWGEGAQKKLAGAYVVVVGCGSIGATLAAQLAAAGVGHLGVVDEGLVRRSTLGGQIVHFAPDAGAGKADALAHKLGLLNPEVQCDPFPAAVDHQNAAAIVAGAALVADCTRDGGATLSLAGACAESGVTLLVGTAAGARGATVALSPGDDLPSSGPSGGLPQASDQPGVLGFVTAAVATDLAQRALALLTGAGDPAAGVLREYDGTTGAWSVGADTGRTADG